MPAVTDVIWAPQKLQASLKSAFVSAVKDTQRVAQGLNPAPSKIRVVIPRLDPSSGQAVIMGRGSLAHIFEEGRQGGYPIQPGLKVSKAGRLGGSKSGNIAIKFTHGDGGFYSGPGFLGGPMAAHPYMRPARDTFVLNYRRRASSALGAFRI